MEHDISASYKFVPTLLACPERGSFLLSALGIYGILDAGKVGLGQGADCKSINADRLKEAVVSVLEDEQIRENQRKIREEIARAPGNAGAVRIIEAFMQRQFFTNP